MRSHLAILSAVLSLATPALAQYTQIIFEGSSDQGRTWQGGTIPYAPGTTLYIRARVSLVNAGTRTVLGLGGIIFQPKLTSFTPSEGDFRLPFSVGGISGVEEEPQTNMGRILPFAASGMGSGSASGLLTAHQDPGNVLRFAGANAITPTTNPSWGVASNQLPPAVAGTNFRSGTDAVVF